MKRLVAAGIAFGLFTIATSAGAQAYVYGATTELMGGVQSASTDGSPGLSRASTTLRVGADAYVDERPSSILGVSALLALEPRPFAGFDVRYLHRLNDRLFAGAGGVGYVLPQSMFGATAELTYRKSLGTGALVAGPHLSAFLQGSALPEDTVVWQALLRVGYRFDL